MRDFAPEDLVGRDDELAEVARFCAGTEPYLWWQAAPWAGKSALAAWVALHPPDGVIVVSFFITGRLRGQADSDAFTEAMVEQLAWVAGELAPTRHSVHDRDADRRRLLDTAAARARQQGRRLLIIVDGLDEDIGAAPGRLLPSIASLLPPRPPPQVKVMVTSRLEPGLPSDVPPGHPLRRRESARRLPPSVLAGELRTQATHELEQRLHSPDRSQADVIGFIPPPGR